MLPPFDPLTVPPEDIPATLSVLASWQAQLCARLLATPAQPESTPDDDTLLTAEEAATILRRSSKWLYRRASKLPFARHLDNRSWVFSKKGLEKWIARQKS
jgi:predicted DNA-binding transcriptional regulator AlpA